MLSFVQLIDRFIADLERDGATVIVEEAITTKPARIRVLTPERVTDCLLFLWNITPGGGGPTVRPATERRIQITAATKFTLEVGQQTIVGGWSEEASAWGFWDVLRHSRFSKKSPSFQMHIGTLEQGFQDGVAVQRRKTKPPEVMVAVSRDFLLWYVEQGHALHRAEDDQAAVANLVEASPEHEREFVDSSTDEAQAVRRYRIVETMRAFREARFRPAVLQAYSHQCAVCPISLNLVDAAHIVPVRQPESTDEIINGIALCRLHHAAFDHGLIGVRPDYKIVENPRAVSRLKELNFLRGIDGFRARLRSSIRYPNALEVRPKQEYLRRGMELRNFPPELLG